MRKDNELLILANKGIPEAKKPYSCLDTTLQRKSQETPQKPLKGRFTDYASEFIDCTSPCERLDPLYQAFLDMPYEAKVAMELTETTEEDIGYAKSLDKDKAWIEKTERELF